MSRLPVDSNVFRWEPLGQPVRGTGEFRDGLFTGSGESKLVERCTYPLTGIGGIFRVYADHGAFDASPGGASVVDLVRGFNLDNGRRTTGLPLLVVA